MSKVINKEVFGVNSEHISNFFPVFLLLTLEHGKSFLGFSLLTLNIVGVIVIMQRQSWTLYFLSLDFLFYQSFDQLLPTCEGKSHISDVNLFRVLYISLGGCCTKFGKHYFKLYLF